MKDIDFTLFNSLELPEPIKEHDSIVLFCENYYDGVGDFDSLKNYIKMIREQIADKKYKINLIVAIHRVDPAHAPVQHKQINARADYVTSELKRLKEESKIKDYVLLTNFNGKMQNVIDFDQARIGEILDQGSAFLTISYTGQLREFVEKVEKKCGHKIIRCSQLGTKMGWNKQDIHEVFHSATMSLPRGDVNAKDKDVCYGLPVEPSVDFEKKPELIYQLQFDSEMGKQLLEEIIGHSNPTYEEVNKYYQEHAMMPGYPQTAVAASNFILIGILKNLTNGNQLLKPIDFFLPKGIVDEEFLKKMLVKMGLDIEFRNITPQVSSTLKTPVRIFSGFRLDDQHYSNLYSARNDLGLGSGDNTLIKVISSEILPLFQDKVGSIRDFNQFEMVELVKIMISEQSDSNVKVQLTQLKDYFMKIAGFVAGGPPRTSDAGKFNVSNQGADEMIRKDDLNELQNHYDEYYQYIKNLTDYAKNPNVQSAWKMVSKRIEQKFNYRKNFRGILNGAFLLNNPNLKLKTISDKELNFDEFFAELENKKEQTLNRSKPMVFGFVQDKVENPNKAKNQIADMEASEKTKKLSNPGS